MSASNDVGFFKAASRWKVTIPLTGSSAVSLSF